MPVPNTRRHDVDALRAIAFGLLMLYHCGMYYVSWGWHVKSQYPAEWLEPLMLLVNQWRMPLIFVISGLAVHFLLGKLRPGAFAKARIKRLLLPLVFGMAVIIPPQAYVEARFNDAFSGSYWAFLQAYFGGAAWPDDAFAGSENGMTWNHLWYLPYLLFYTLAVLPLALWLRGRGAGIRQRLLGLRGLWLVLLPLAPLMLVGHFVFPHFPYINHGLLTDWYAHGMYGWFFVLGVLIGRDAGLWAHLARIRWPLLALGLTSFAANFASRELLHGELSTAESLGYAFVLYLNRWVWILLILAWGHHALNRPMAWLRWANDAVYPWYILHQTLTVIAGYWLLQVPVGPVLDPVLLLLATFGGCWVLHRYVVAPSAWLRPLFGMKPRPKVPNALTAAA